MNNKILKFIYILKDSVYSLTIGIVFSIIPASNASRKNTIDILKD